MDSFTQHIACMYKFYITGLVNYSGSLAQLQKLDVTNQVHIFFHQQHIVQAKLYVNDIQHL